MFKTVDTIPPIVKANTTPEQQSYAREWIAYGARWVADDDGAGLRWDLQFLIWVDRVGGYVAPALYTPAKRRPNWDKARTRGMGLDAYRREYERGWGFARRSGEISQAAFDRSPWAMGTSSDAYDDGYLDARMGRPKWHMAFCPDHDHCGMD